MDSHFVSRLHHNQMKAQRNQAATARIALRKRLPNKQHWTE